MFKSSSSIQDWGLSLQEAPDSHVANEAHTTEGGQTIGVACSSQVHLFKIGVFHCRRLLPVTWQMRHRLQRVVKQLGLHVQVKFIFSRLGSFIAGGSCLSRGK